jgi:hypothetical protein
MTENTTIAIRGSELVFNARKGAINSTGTEFEDCVRVLHVCPEDTDLVDNRVVVKEPPLLVVASWALCPKSDPPTPVTVVLAVRGVLNGASKEDFGPSDEVREELGLFILPVEGCGVG